MPNDFPPDLDELYETFDDLSDWNERYEFIVDLGRELPAMPAELQAEENKVKGCMSTVWMVARPSHGDPQTIELVADSDSLIVKGLIAILMTLYSGRSPAEILQRDVQGVFERLGLTQHLSPSRRNGLFSMIKRVRQLAVQCAAVAK